MIRLVLLAALLLVGLHGPAAAVSEVCGAQLAIASDQDAALRRFAASARLAQPEAFIHVVDWIRRTGQLPDCYLDKRRAEAARWHPGSDLWAAAPGTAIGGDRFGNLEGRLPTTWNGRYVEADLDYAGGRRGGTRLIFVKDMGAGGPLWVTTDHYRSFQRVPAP